MQYFLERNCQTQVIAKRCLEKPSEKMVQPGVAGEAEEGNFFIRTPH